MSELQKELSRIQRELKAPKNQYNSFGKYNYRSCEDILEGLKTVQGDCVVTLTDDIKEIGGRIYVMATATIILGKDAYCVNAFAREPETKKGMDASQITGTASSYARKYALNGLFLIDDTKDADSMNNTQQPKPSTNAQNIHEEAVELVKSMSDKLTPEQLQWCSNEIQKGNAGTVIKKLKQGK
jgi:hypothetical protein